MVTELCGSLCTADGRHLDQGEAVGGDGADPREGEPHDGGAPGGDFPGARDHGLAASVTAARAAGLRVSGAAAGGVRRRLLLARVSAARHVVEGQRAILAGEDRAQPGARPGGEPRTAPPRLAGAPHPGA